jgi:transcription elongation factor Elf1
MATQICPKCKKDDFSWYIDDEMSSITIWNCGSCDFQTYEDERDEVLCKKCNEITKTFLKNEEEEFWWCSVCNTISDIKYTTIE